MTGATRPMDHQVQQAGPCVIGIDMAVMVSIMTISSWRRRQQTPEERASHLKRTAKRMQEWLREIGTDPGHHSKRPGENEINVTINPPPDPSG
jgi:hypothetical protein